MKFRKLLLCLLMGIALTGFANVYTYAAEEDNIVTEDTKVQDTTVGTIADGAVVNDNNGVTNNTTNTDSSIGTNDGTNTTLENGTAAPAEEVKNNEAAEEKAAADKKAEEKAAAEKKAAEEKKATAEKKAAAEKKASEEKKAAEAKKAADAKKAEEVSYSKADLRLLSALIYCEANGESYNGKLAVAIVVMNRVRSGAYPDSVKGVIYQRYQFGPVTNGSLNNTLSQYDNDRFNSDSEQECVKAAKEALSGTTDITVSGAKKNFSKYLYFSGSLRGNTFSLGNHEFK